jgi:hypothetical protein
MELALFAINWQNVFLVCSRSESARHSTAEQPHPIANNRR